MGVSAADPRPAAAAPAGGGARPASGREAGLAPSRAERRLLAALVVLGALRVLAFAAAFPFFHPIDEHLHVDLVHKYARGYLPTRERPRFDAASARLIAAHASPEYGKGPDAHAEGRVPTPAEVRALRPPGSLAYRIGFESLTGRANVEADAPPLYYVAAGAWLRVGRRLGLDGLALLYWLRWPNALVLAGSVALLGALLSTRADTPLLRIGPPALVAVWPNDLLYGVTPDVLALLLGTMALVLLVRLHEDGAELPLHLVAGIVLALAFLDKYPGIAFSMVAAGCALAALGRAGGGRRALAVLWRWGATAAAAAAVALPWLARNAAVLGDPSGRVRKVAWMGWRESDLEAALDHPLLGWRGWFEFVPHLLETLWRGEFSWHGRPQHPALLDPVWGWGSLALLGLAAAAAGARVVRARRRARAGPRAASGARLESVCWGVLVASVALLAVLSTLFDYGVDEGPLSRAFPYLASGRLIAGAWPAVAVLLVRGIAVAWRPAPARTRVVGAWATLAGLVLLALVCELWLAPSVFASSWNWFHGG